MNDKKSLWDTSKAYVERKESLVFVCGDTHGTRDLRKLYYLCRHYPLTYRDYVIIVGDAGIVWGGLTKEHIEIYEKLQTNILFVDGNHEDFGKLKKYPVIEWNGGKVHKISEHIFHLMRGEVFNIAGRKILALGGGDSHDKDGRIEGESWWKDEAITELDIENAVDNLSQVDFKVDYIITHTPCKHFQDKLTEIYTQCGEDVPPYILEKFNSNESGKKLDELLNVVKFYRWYCGHLHTDESYGKFSVLYEQCAKLDVLEPIDFEKECERVKRDNEQVKVWWNVDVEKALTNETKRLCDEANKLFKNLKDNA